jgi:hypothetical protein
VTVAEYLAAHDLSILALSKATGISYSTLHPHVRRGKGLSLNTARRLEEYSSGAMTAADVLGLGAATRRRRSS